MVRQASLKRFGIATSRLGFGTSRLHYLNARARQSLLSCAADCGIVHFDTAPAYGDGEAERALAKLLRERRSSIVVATKFGVAADPVIDSFPAIAPAWRIGRAVLRRANLSRPSLPELTVRELNKSIEASLRRLATDRIDIVLLHEPTNARLGRASELLEELGRLVSKGTIRGYGLAGNWRDLDPIIRGPANALGAVLQTEESGWTSEVEPDITFGVLSGGRQSYFQGNADGAAIEASLSQALSRRPQGVVLVSTTKLQNLKALAAVAARANP